MSSYIGTNAASASGLGNKRNGILIDGGADYNRIGPYTSTINPTLNTSTTSYVSLGVNIISGNLVDGIMIRDASDNTIAGNLIGTTASGSAPLANVRNGVEIVGSALQNSVGVATPSSSSLLTAAANVISGNGQNGVAIHDTVTVAGLGTNTYVFGNFIGTDRTGNTALPNRANGVLVSNSSGNWIGRTASGGQPNVISGNTLNGVSITNMGSTDNKLAANLIGVGANLSSNVKNLIYGVSFDGISARNWLTGNVIENNVKAAVYDPNPKNTVYPLNIIANNGYGIRNNTLNGTPVITNVTYFGTTLTIAGTVSNSTPNAALSLEFFGNLIDNRQGLSELGTWSASTDGSGSASFTATLSEPLGPAGPYIDATATVQGPNGWTSEFSTDFSFTWAGPLPGPNLASLSPAVGPSGGGNVGHHYG